MCWCCYFCSDGSDQCLHLLTQGFVWGISQHWTDFREKGILLWPWIRALIWLLVRRNLFTIHWYLSRLWVPNLFRVSLIEVHFLSKAILSNAMCVNCGKVAIGSHLLTVWLQFVVDPFGVWNSTRISNTKGNWPRVTVSKASSSNCRISTCRDH